jgi:hypothetical protein
MTSGGVTRLVLHELQVISSTQSRYKPSWTDRGLYKRADHLNDDYVAKAKTADQVHGGVQARQVGRVETKLISFQKVEGIVFGNCGEAS